ncbi:hypothetical protein KM043_003643 [Ampulex compressa]|nr:hypothetical protein KM043_003643 [Ampulex compressa]
MHTVPPFPKHSPQSVRTPPFLPAIKSTQPPAMEIKSPIARDLAESTTGIFQATEERWNIVRSAWELEAVRAHVEASARRGWRWSRSIKGVGRGWSRGKQRVNAAGRWARRQIVEQCLRLDVHMFAEVGLHLENRITVRSTVLQPGLGFEDYETAMHLHTVRTGGFPEGGSAGPFVFACGFGPGEEVSPWKTGPGLFPLRSCLPGKYQLLRCRRLFSPVARFMPLPRPGSEPKSWD